MNDLDLCLEVVQGHINHCGVNSSKTTWAKDFKFGTRLSMGNAELAHNNLPWKWAWPRSRDHYNFWHTIEHISKTTWATDFKFTRVTALYGECRAGAQIIVSMSAWSSVTFSSVGERDAWQAFLADGRAYATVLRLSVCRLSVVCDVMYCG